MRDVILCIRADEAIYRSLNHYFSDVIKENSRWAKVPKTKSAKGGVKPGSNKLTRRQEAPEEQLIANRANNIN